MFVKNTGAGAALLIARLLSRLIFLVFVYIWPYRRTVILENLTACFPEYSAEKIRHLCLQYYRHLADLIAETGLLASLSGNDFEKLVAYENLALIHELAAANQDIVLIASHYGNWEYLFQLPQVTNYQVLAAYTPIANPVIDRKLKKIRSRFGIKLIPKSEWYRTTLSWPRHRPSMFITIADQRPCKSGGLSVDFFGRPTFIQAGAARIAAKRNCAVVYADVEKQGSNKYKFRLHLIAENAVLAGETELMQRYYQCLETTIRNAPAYWLWSHRRWKQTGVTTKSAESCANVV